MSTRLLGTRLYVGAVIAAGLVLLAAMAPRELPDPAITFGLLASALILSAFKVRLPLGHGPATLSMAHAVDFVALILAGVHLAMLVGAVGVLVQCTIRVRRKQPLHRTAFSAAAVVVSVQFAGLVWQAMGGSLATLSVTGTLAPLFLTASVYFVVNTALVVGAIAFTSAVSPMKVWTPEFFWTAPSYFVSALAAGLVVFGTMHGNYALLLVAAVPVVICYREYARRWLDALSDFGRPTGTPATAV
jgi:hypothetical protein